MKEEAVGVWVLPLPHILLGAFLPAVGAEVPPIASMQAAQRTPQQADHCAEPACIGCLRFFPSTSPFRPSARAEACPPPKTELCTRTIQSFPNFSLFAFSSPDAFRLVSSQLYQPVYLTPLLLLADIPHWHHIPSLPLYVLPSYTKVLSLCLIQSVLIWARRL